MGGVGTRAGMGETQIEIDRRLIRTKISKLNKDLKKIDMERTIESQKRKTEFRVALVGYTNAGKSTLMTALSKSDVFAENKLFATLDPIHRRLDLDFKKNAVISDTVGFIRGLPHHLIESFKSTLEEIASSDIVLHVRDLSSPYLISEGKAKSLYETQNQNELLMVYRDDTSAFDGKKKEALKGKGEINNKLSLIHI